MAINLCDVADTLACNPSPDNEMFRPLVIRALLGITNAIVATNGGSGVVLPQVAKAFGVIPASFASLGLLDSTKKLSRFYADNQTDANIEISLDGGVTVAFTVFASSSLTRDLGAYVGAATTSVQYRYASATVPTIGTAYFDGSY